MSGREIPVIEKRCFLSQIGKSPILLTREEGCKALHCLSYLAAAISRIWIPDQRSFYSILFSLVGRLAMPPISDKWNWLRFYIVFNLIIDNMDRYMITLAFVGLPLWCALWACCFKVKL